MKQQANGGVGLLPDPSTPAVSDPPPRPGRRVALVVLAALTVFLAGGLGLWRTVGTAPPPIAISPDQQSSALAVSPFIPTGSLAQEIASLQKALRTSRYDWRSYANLGRIALEAATLLMLNRARLLALEATTLLMLRRARLLASKAAAAELLSLEAARLRRAHL